MNKRLIAFFLCLVMMLSVFLAGCAKDSEEDAKNELEQAKVASNMTLTMWIVSESPVSEEIRADVTAAINALTRTKYKTQLEIQYLSEEEYFSKLTTAMETFAENKKQQNAGKPAETGTTAEGDGTTVEEIVTDEHGMYRDNYPVVLENQVDIIYIGNGKDSEGNQLSGQQMYNKLRADDWLAPLDEALKGDAKKIKEFVSPTLLSAVQEKGVTYAIPNNNPIGEYTYMCLNKELMDKYSLQGHIARGSIKNFANEYVYQFIDQIARYGTEDLLPIDATYEECLAQLAYYWNVDPETYAISNEEFSVFGTPLFDLQPNRGQNIVGVQSLFENEEFTKHYLALNEYRLEKAYRFMYDESIEDYVEDRGEGKEIVFFRNEENKDQTYAQYGIKFVKGTLELLDANGNYWENGVGYYAIPVAYPAATDADIYGNMFAVAKTTLSVERSMQIITYLNTNSEIRNLLQYGIESEHYIVKQTKNPDGGTIKSIELQPDKNGNKYEMDIYATGNAFLSHILYKEDDEGKDVTNYAIWANGKKQNRDSLVEPLLGFNLAEYAETATQFGIPTTIPVTKMYSTTFRSNLSKDDFAEDEVLSAWLKECNDAGKGVYVFRSRQVTDSKENDEILYFYNNTGSYRFSVESVEEPKEGGGFFRTNTYIYTEDSKLPVNYGYTLTMVYDLCPSKYVKTEGDAKIEVPYKVVNRVLNKKGEEDENSRTECTYTEVFNYKTAKYDFDLYETKSYKLNVYGDLFVGDFYENKAIYNELRVLLEKAETKKENLGLHWVDTESSEEMDYHTFVLYRRNMEYATLIDVVPSLRNGKLTLMVNYDEREHTGEIKNPTNYGDPGVRPGKRYSLYYVTLEVAKGADVSIAYSVGQTTESELSVGPVTGEFTYEKGDGLIEIATPIDYDIHGMLNTELVKYMAELNDVAVTLLDNCTSMEMLKKRVAYLSLLLNTEKQLSGVNNFPSATDTEAFDKEIDDLIRIKDNASVFYNGNFSELFYQLTHMTNYGTMEEVKEGLSKIGGGTTKEADEYRPIFYSPYGIYYLWMEAYQYLPANMQTETK